MRFWLKWGGIVGGSFGLVVLVLYLTVIDFWRIPTDDADLMASIAPNLEGGDLVVVAKDWVPTIPDLVRCEDPDRPGEYVIARIAALGGESIRVASDIVYNGKRRAPSPRRCAQTVLKVADKNGNVNEVDCWIDDYAGRDIEVTRSGDHRSPAPDFAKEVPNGQIFLISDNRPMHVDSRDFGPIDAPKCRRIYVALWGASGIITSPKFRWLN